ncbi:hypothetical protein IW152_003955 [Coemansia sp. BCRC 34962]|nr:hypothetical protein IW152_003955 [Coemansia sp. BCRC 34962]
MAVSSLSLSTATSALCASVQQPLSQTPVSNSKSAGSTATTTAVCTPATASNVRPGGGMLELGELTRVHEGTNTGAAASKLRELAESPTQLVAHRRQKQPEDPSKRLQATADLAPSKLASDECGSIYASGSANDTCDDRPLHDVNKSQGTLADHSVALSEDLTRHPTLVFDRSPILRTSELIGALPTERGRLGSMPEIPSDSEQAPQLRDPSSDSATRNSKYRIVSAPEYQKIHVGISLSAPSFLFIQSRLLLYHFVYCLARWVTNLLRPIRATGAIGMAKIYRAFAQLE